MKKREIRQEDAIYNLVKFDVRNAKVLNFSIIVTLNGTATSKILSFQNKFIVDYSEKTVAFEYTKSIYLFF